MFTMGAVCVARIAIEQSRQYSIGYLAALAMAAFVVMSRFVVGSVVFCAGILALIAYLSDRIVHDCTLIDDTQDASGQGLIDFGSSQLKRQLDAPASDQISGSEIESAREEQPAKAGHQPGRTVMYLAIAALPLFGFGQFLLRSDSATWSSAQKYLAIYLFSSLSLLVTTSFLGLRRYLRQRKVDMPNDVAVAWLAGGLVMIGLILSVAYLAPMPGQALASIQMPEFLTAPKDLQASSMGWGDEGANQAPDDSNSTANDKQTKDKETQGIRQEKGAPPGKTQGGDGKQGPSGEKDGGKKDGGNKSGGKKPGQKKNPSGKKSPSQEKQKNQSKKGEQTPNAQQGKQQSEGSPPGGKRESESSKKRRDEKSNEQENRKRADKEQPDREKGNDESRDSNSEGQKADDKEASDKSSESSQDSDSDSDKPPPKDSDQASDQPDSDSSTQNKSSESQSNSASQSNAGESPPPKPSSNSSSMGSFFSALGGILRFVVMAGLLAVVVAFVYLYRDALAAWWDGLWNRDTDDPPLVVGSKQQSAEPQTPPPPFSSFRNPIGSEKDPRKIVVVTFQAFEAWTREQGWQRNPEETPSEFIRRVAGSIPTAATPATQIVDAYNRIVYGRGKATRRDLTAAKQVWQAMQS